MLERLYGQYAKYQNNPQQLLIFSLDYLIGLKRDGTLEKWGGSKLEKNAFNLKNIISISAYGLGAAAIKSDGSISLIGWCEKFKNIPEECKDITSIAIGADFAVALR